MLPITRPGDERGFVHKKIFGGIKQLASIALPFIPGGGIATQIAGRLIGGGRGGQRTAPARAVLPAQLTSRPTAQGVAGQELARGLKFGLNIGGPNGDDGCIFPWRRAPDGQCRLFIGDRPGPDADVPVGEAVMGRYGAGLSPGSMVIDRAVCLRGMQLGNDGVCYNKAQISNKQRMWPAGRKPLLTGGDMRAISIASRAAHRFEKTEKRLQAMGMLKKPRARRSLPHAHARAATNVVSV